MTIAPEDIERCVAVLKMLADKKAQQVRYCAVQAENQPTLRDMWREQKAKAARAEAAMWDAVNAVREAAK